MRVLYFGTYSLGEGYPRNSVIIQGLRESGVEVIECHADLWSGARDKIKGAKSVGGSARVVPRLLKTYLTLIRRFMKSPGYDLIIVGYTGQIDIFLARVLNLRQKKPLVLDAFISLYDTIVKDRKLAKAGSLKAGLLWWLDKTACGLADRVLLDTNEHIDYFVKEFGTPRKKFIRVFVGGDEVAHLPESAIQAEGAKAAEADKKGKEGTFTVLYFGTYIPLHGTEYIIKAAKLLKGHRDIRFTLVGTGQLLAKMQKLASDISSTNIEFINRWTSSTELASYIRNADVCLGIFGTTEKASRVIPCKIFDCMAFGKPIVTADTPAAQELLQDGMTAVLVESGNPEAIAASVLTLKSNHALSRKIGKKTKEVYEERCLPGAIGRELSTNLSNRLQTAS
jgi:glycosyltransferase involved in cell wall biosynthesis